LITPLIRHFRLRFDYFITFFADITPYRLPATAPPLPHAAYAPGAALMSVILSARYFAAAMAPPPTRLRCLPCCLTLFAPLPLLPGHVLFRADYMPAMPSFEIDSVYVRHAIDDITLTPISPLSAIIHYYWPLLLSLIFATLRLIFASFLHYCRRHYFDIDTPYCH
jgi:hypothetical protein